MDYYRAEATRQARQSPLYFDLPLSLSKSASVFHAFFGGTPAWPAKPETNPVRTTLGWISDAAAVTGPSARVSPSVVL